jgi:hypothetical protein
MGEQTDWFRKNILVALHGVKPFGPAEHNDHPQDLTRFLINQKQPVSRFLRVALIELQGGEFMRETKSSGRPTSLLEVRYIHDWKHTSWSLYSPVNPAVPWVSHRVRHRIC